MGRGRRVLKRREVRVGGRGLSLPRRLPLQPHLWLDGRELLVGSLGGLVNASCVLSREEEKKGISRLDHAGS
jgi:hypothetical protein